MIQFSDGSTLEGVIQNSDESAYRGQVERLAGWCSENDLELNVSKTKDMVFDLRKKETPLVITHYSWRGSWRSKGIVVVLFCFLLFLHNHFLWPKMGREYQLRHQKAHQRLFFLRQLKKFSQSFHPDSVLPCCDWEHPDIFHHCLVQQLVSNGQRSTRQDSPNSL